MAIYFLELYHDCDNYKWHAIMNCIANSGAERSKVALSERSSQIFAAVTEGYAVRERR